MLHMDGYFDFSEIHLYTVKNHDFLIFLSFFFFYFQFQSVQRKFTLKSWIHNVILFLTAGHFILLFLSLSLLFLMLYHYVSPNGCRSERNFSFQ